MTIMEKEYANKAKSVFNEEIKNARELRDELKEIKLLTDKVSNRFKKFAEAFNKESKNLYVRAANAFHDRYIITDINQFWYLGSSIDKHLGSKYTIFMLAVISIS